MTRDELSKIAEYLVGTCNSIDEALERFDVVEDTSEVEDQLLDLPEGVECCPGCGWWVNSWELVDDNNDLCLCENCR